MKHFRIWGYQPVNAHSMIIFPFILYWLEPKHVGETAAIQLGHISKTVRWRNEIDLSRIIFEYTICFLDRAKQAPSSHQPGY